MTTFYITVSYRTVTAAQITGNPLWFGVAPDRIEKPNSCQESEYFVYMIVMDSSNKWVILGL
jgi:hypothetical protein